MYKTGYRMMLLAILAAATGATGCGKNSPAAPSTEEVHARHDIDYDINVPDAGIAAQLRVMYPNGVQMSPIQAQQLWNYTTAYGGTPNVYLGTTASDACHYQHTGIVIAPVEVASVASFHGRDWPGIGLIADDTYQWVGRFTYAMPASPDQYTTGSCF